MVNFNSLLIFIQSCSGILKKILEMTKKVQYDDVFIIKSRGAMEKTSREYYSNAKVFKVHSLCPTTVIPKCINSLKSYLLVDHCISFKLWTFQLFMFLIPQEYYCYIDVLFYFEFKPKY